MPTNEDVDRNEPRRMRFTAIVNPEGNATGVAVPSEIVSAMGREGRPPVVVTINGFSWRTRIAAMRGQRLIGISAAQRKAANINEGDLIEVTIERDDAPRTVELPDDVAKALKGDLLLAFERIPFGLRQKYVRDIIAAKSDDIRARRIQKLIDSLTP